MRNITDLMTRDVLSFQVNTPLQDAIKVLIENKISGAPVITEEGHIVGVITELDLMTIYWNKEAKVIGDVMTIRPFSFSIRTPIVDVVDCLMANNFRRVFVHDGHNRLVGLVSRSDLMPWVLESLINR